MSTILSNKVAQFFMEISLPHSFTRAIDFNQIEYNFIITYDNNEYHFNKSITMHFCKRLQIKSLSNSLLASLSVPKADGIDGDFSAIASFFRGAPLRVTDENMFFVFYVASYLLIDTILEPLQRPVCEQMHCPFALRYVQLFSDFGADISAFIAVLSANAESIPDEGFDALSPVVIDSVLSACKQPLRSAAAARAVRRHRGRLLRHLSGSDSEIAEIVSAPDCNLCYAQAQVCALLSKREFAPAECGKRFLFDGRNHFDGVIDYLAQRAHGNPAKRGAIGLESARPASAPYGAENMLERYASASSFKTRGGEPLWFVIDFRSARIAVDAYTISTFPRKNGSVGPSDWALTGSCDGERWDGIDERAGFDFEAIEGDAKVATFAIPKGQQRFRYVRFEQTAVDRCRTLTSIINFELFGVLYEDE